MTYLEALILGLIQGFTEFLPVSSSGHLELAKSIFNVDLEGNESIIVTVILHLATVLSTIVVFRKEILELITGLFQFKWNEESQFSTKIVISMIPATIVGLAFEDQIDALFENNILLVGGMLLLTGALLFLADRAKSTDKDVSFKNAFLVGISQAIAILPGISRSGATISTSVLLGIDRAKAAKFSFLMVIPLILGKVAKDILSGKMDFSSEMTIPLIIGFFAAFFAGLLACKWMIALVKNSNLKYFAYYCFAVGIIAIIFKLT